MKLSGCPHPAGPAPALHSGLHRTFPQETSKRGLTRLITLSFMSRVICQQFIAKLRPLLNLICNLRQEILIILENGLKKVLAPNLSWTGSGRHSGGSSGGKQENWTPGLTYNG